jgi:hypothetical protein
MGPGSIWQLSHLAEDGGDDIEKADAPPASEGRADPSWPRAPAASRMRSGTRARPGPCRRPRLAGGACSPKAKTCVVRGVPDACGAAHVGSGTDAGQRRASVYHPTQTPRRRRTSLDTTAAVPPRSHIQQQRVLEAVSLELTATTQHSMGPAEASSLGSEAYLCEEIQKYGKIYEMTLVCTYHHSTTSKTQTGTLCSSRSKRERSTFERRSRRMGIVSSPSTSFTTASRNIQVLVMDGFGRWPIFTRAS